MVKNDKKIRILSSVKNENGTFNGTDITYESSKMKIAEI